MVGIEDKLDSPPAMEVVYDILPRDLPHGWKYLAFGPDGKLYFNIGAPCNICIPPDTHANISRVNPDGTGFEYVAHGVRNSVGFDWHPVTKELYFATHARDWLGEDVPSDRFDVASKKGLHFGFPYCHQGDILDPEFGKGRSCARVRAAADQDRPARGRQRRRVLHRLDVPRRVQEPRVPGPARLLEPDPEERLPVMMVTLRTGDVPKYEVFAEGWLQGDQIWGRPGLHPADEGRLAPDRRRLRGGDLPGHLPALSAPRLLTGLSLAVALVAAAGGARRSRRGPRGGPAQGRAVRGLPRPRRQRDHPRHAVPRRAARLLHALAAHQVPRRPAEGSGDVAARRDPERRGHGRSRRLLRRAAAPPAPRGHRSGAGRGRAAARRSSTTAPRVIAPGLSGRSRPRAWPARTSTTSCACCAPSRPAPPPISTGP